MGQMESLGSFDDLYMRIDIDKLTEEELIDLNHRIVERLRMIRELRAHGAMMNFRIGERVVFYPDPYRK